MNRNLTPIVIESLQRNLGSNNIVTLPVNIWRCLHNRRRNEIKVGLSKADVVYYPNRTRNVIEVSRNLMESIGLVQGMKANVFTSGNVLFVGPVIGVFTSNGSVRKASAQNVNFRMCELANANKEANAILYHFSIKDIDFINKKILGTYYNEVTEKWEKMFFPFPDVLYDRGGGTLKNQKIISNYIREQFENCSELKKINNRYYFDKWDTYEKLKSYDEMAPYIPPTCLYKGPDDLREMFKESCILYIKDCLGSNGRGVVRVEKVLDDEYNISYFCDDLIEHKCISFEKLIEKIESIFKGKKVIIQCAIDVIQVDNRNADMRATVQRNGKGELEVSAYPVRLARERCPITSTKSGSIVYRFEDFFKKYYNFSEEEISILKEKINQMLFTSFRCIENAYGSFGELGIDFALDKQGNIWFIECNAKPGKDSLYLSYDDDDIKRAFLNPLEYAKFLWSLV